MTCLKDIIEPLCDAAAKALADPYGRHGRTWRQAVAEGNVMYLPEARTRIKARNAIVVGRKPRGSIRNCIVIDPTPRRRRTRRGRVGKKL